MIKDEENIITNSLKTIGLNVNSIYDLVNMKQPYPKAIPILVDLLKINFKDRWLLEGIIRALAVKEAKGIANEPLIKLYNSIDYTENSLKWVIGNTLSVVAVENDLSSLIEICKNKQNGTSRQMIIIWLGKSKSKIVEDLLIELLDENGLQLHSLDALSKLKSSKAITKIDLLINSSNAILKKAAIKAKSRILA